MPVELSQFFHPSDFLYMGPAAVFIVAGLVAILMEAVLLGRKREPVALMTVFSCVLAIAASVWLYWRIESGVPMVEGADGLGPAPLRNDWPPELFGGMIVADRFGAFFGVLFSLVAGMTALLAAPHQKEYGWQSGEFYAILLLATAGMCMLAMAGDLVIVFLGVEIMSIATYVLTASRWNSRRSAEAAMKYFLMGAFASGFLLYGMALTYGATGTTDLSDIATAISANYSDPLVIVAVFLLVIGFGFKVAAVPFHMWTPDVYEGAPTPVTGFMAAAVKAAAFAGLVRVLGDAFGGEVFPYGRMGWAGILAALAAITMTVGNVAALRQRNIKRMLAYSSISHAGVVLVGVVAIGLGAASEGRSSVLYYLMAYSVTTVGAFGVISWVGSRGQERVLVDDWAGLAQRHPTAALAMTLFMLSLAGMPPTGGFLGKFLVFKAAMQTYDQQMLWLVVVGVLNSVISIFYYLRVVMAMYFRDPLGEFQPTRAAAYVFVIAVCAALVLHMGLLPGRWLIYTAG